MKQFWEHYTDPIPEQLIAALGDKRLVAFIGAGISRKCLSKTRAPLPDWAGLLRSLVDWGSKESLILPEITECLHQLISRNEYLMVAQECRDLIGVEVIGDFIQEVFEPAGIVPSRLHELLAIVPFCGYITTNYDNLLERAQVQVQHRQFRLLFPESANDFFAEPQRFCPLLKLHGDLDDPMSIVLSHRDYNRLVWSPEYIAFVRRLLVDYTILFVGYSLSDLDVLLPLDQLVYEGGNFQHFLLSRKGERNVVEKKRLLLDRKIQVIEYLDYFGFHNHVDTFIEGLLSVSGKGDTTAKVRVPLRSRICVHYAQEDEDDGLFVWHYVFRDGAITLSEEPQHSQWKHLKDSLADGLRAMDHLVFLVTEQSLAAADFRDTIVQSLTVARNARVLVVFLLLGFDRRPDFIADAAPTSPAFLLKNGFSELDLEAFRQYLAEDIKAGHRQP